jgi:hypothetical protein
MTDEKLYHCSSLTERDENGNGSITLCGISTGFLSWDFPMDFVECKVGPAYGHGKCKDCENHPDLPMALLGDVDDE